MQPRFETLSNGLRVVLAPCEAESVAVGVFISSGSRHETARTAGISHLIEHMLFKGTPSRRQIDITRAIEGRGGNFNAFTAEEATCYYAHLPREYRAEAIDILADMYLNASIPDDEFAREREVVIEEIRMYADEPDQVAAENLQKALFPNSRLGDPIAGNEAALRGMTPEILRRYIKSHYLPSRTVVVVAGDFDEGDALADVASRFKFPAGAQRRCASVSRPDLPLSGKCVRETSVSKDVQQTQLALGYRTFGISDPRKYAATVLDAVLGRGMSSRLFQEVREKRGLSYDISSRMQFFSDAGAFSISAGTDERKSALALATVEAQIDRVRRFRVSAAELKRTKEFLAGNFRMSHERVTAKMFFYGSTMLSFGRLVLPSEQVDGIRAVGPDEVLAVARAIFRPGNRAVSWVRPASAAK